MAAVKDYDYLLKILLVGESGVGKSSLLLRYADGSFSPSYISTIGVDFKMKKVVINDKTVKLQIWDTAGQERYRTIVASFYRGAHGIILTFDVTDVNSFLKVRRKEHAFRISVDLYADWLGEIKVNAPRDTKILLVGNKSDFPTGRMVEFKEANQFAQENGLQYVETSAKVGTNVDEAFLKLANECLDVVVTNTSKKTVDVGKDTHQQPQSNGWCSC